MTTWVKVYNSTPTNPKVLKAGDRAAWLYVCGLCYSNEHLTNGFIAEHVLPVVAPGAKALEQSAARLVVAKLWHRVEGGWRIHDYAEHQRSAEEIRGRRAKDAARKAAGRSNGSPHGQVADSAPDSAENPDGVPVDLRAGDRGRSQDVDVEGREQKEEQKNTITSDAGGADQKATDDDKQLCRLLAELGKDRNPKFKVRSRSRWLTDMRLLRERDGNTPAEIEEALRWVFRHHFWAGVIESPGNLREHFPRIWGQMHGSENVIPITGRASAGDLIREINEMESA